MATDAGDEPFRTERVTFPGSTGTLLAARLELPEEPSATAVLAHCFTCSKHSVAAVRIARGLAARAFAGRRGRDRRGSPG